MLQEQEFSFQESLSDNTPVLVISPDKLKKNILKYYMKGYTHLSTIIAYDKNDEIIVDYPLWIPEESKNDFKGIFIETRLDKDHPVLESIEDILPGAIVYEQEIHEILGIQFSPTNGRKHLLLPDNFPSEMYPLRKAVSINNLKDEMDKLLIGLPKKTVPIEADTYTMAVGPQHPTHKEPIRFEFYIKGEEIQNVGLRLGFNYRGIEKALELGSWIQNLYLIERICGICSSAHQLAYVTTAEKIMNMVDEIPEKARWMRSLVAELERIHSHILWYGVLAHDGGFDMMFHVSWRDREIVMDILEEISGNRVNYSIETIGGVRRDLDADSRQKILDKLLYLKKQVKMHQDILEKETTFLLRLQDIGYLSHSDALKFNVVGPTARASGVNFDLRKDVPYAGYSDIPFSRQVESSGDVYASLQVRMKETVDSIDMCIYLISTYPGGEIALPFRNRVVEGKAHTRVEAPRGENFHFIHSTGGKSPDRHKVRAPTLANIGSLLKRFNGMQVADIPMIIRLIDPCIGCMERVTFVNISTNSIRELTGSELTARSRKSFLSNSPVKIFG